MEIHETSVSSNATAKHWSMVPGLVGYLTSTYTTRPIFKKKKSSYIECRTYQDIHVMGQHIKIPRNGCPVWSKQGLWGNIFYFYFYEGDEISLIWHPFSTWHPLIGPNRVACLVRIQRFLHSPWNIRENIITILVLSYYSIISSTNHFI